MAKNNQAYIGRYNKENYKMYQFRVKKDDRELIEYLDYKEKRNQYIVSLIDKDIHHEVYTLKQLKTILLPILKNYGISEVYLFGSYARGEATPSSDIDIYCEKGNIRTFLDQEKLEEELKTALKKDVDILFTSTRLDDYFRTQLMKDLIKLCQ